MEKAASHNRSSFLEVIKAIIVAIIISLIAILVMAFVIKMLSISTHTVPIINQVIKGVSILIACLICLKTPSNGWLKGLTVGILYIALAFVIFSLLDGDFKFGLSLLNDSAIGAVSGLGSSLPALPLTF